VDRKHPGCFIFLLDQSGSMGEPMGGTTPAIPKSQALASTVNDLLQSIVRRSVKDLDGPPRHYYDLGIIGYGEDARPLFGGSLRGRYFASVAEVAEAAQEVTGMDGIVRPVWLTPLASGRTAMCAALELAAQIASGWIQAHRDSFPPIVINVSDGKATDGTPDRLAKAATGLRKLATSDGELLLFNINLSMTAKQSIAFPADPKRLPDDYSRQMFAISSLLPDLMRRTAQARGLPADAAARGFVCNADLDTVIQALEIGTTLHQITEY
jgi:hypothetical protein